MRTILIQSRLSSSRFPQKMLKDIKDFKLVEFVYNRCKISKKADLVAVITSKEKSDDALAKFCENKKIPLFRGSLDDVLDRYIKAAQFFKSDIICRVCGDSPFVDVKAIDEMFGFFEDKTIEYARTTNALNGFLSEIFRLDLLKKIYNYPLTKDDKEHVTKYIIDNIDKFHTKELNIHKRPKSLEHFSLTIDYKKDLEIAKKIAKKLDGFEFSSDEIITILKEIQ